jgi:CRISPR system Cascade subunit CasE
MSARWLSRVQLRPDPSAAALAPVLLPAEADARAGVTHRLLWTLFADRPERRRDFLWREEGRGGLQPGRAAFLVLSARPPEDRHGLFALESKPFAPLLAPGDRLAFALRANPVVSRPNPATGRPRRHDVVMDRLHALPREARAESRYAATLAAGRAWLEAQGGRAGFRLIDTPDATDGSGSRLRVDGYDQIRINRGRGQRPVRFSALDLEGVLEVEAPDRFLAALYGGFGKARAFGCGLMLIRRAPP